MHVGAVTELPTSRHSVCGWLATQVCEASRYRVVEEEGQVFSLSDDIESTVTSRFKQVGLPGPARTVERCALSLQHSGRNFTRFRVEYDQPPADDRRRGEITYSSMSLE